jgi:peptide/nickel transport system substrate-binding protein
VSYWDKSRFPRLRRIIFENTLSQKDAVEAVKSGEGRVDLVTGLSPLETLSVAQSRFAAVVKDRESLASVFGLFNMRKAGSPWRDVRVRQAANLAVKREDVIRYGAKGNGGVVPALIPRQGFGFDPKLAPYPFDPTRARGLLREAGHPDGLPVGLIAPDELQAQATVVGKMLEQGGFNVTLEVLEASAFNRKIDLSHLDRPAEQQPWDIALVRSADSANFPVFSYYQYFAVEGVNVWLTEPAELRRLYNEVLRTVSPDRQLALIQQMERETHDQAYFLFLYNPIALAAVNRAVEFVPHANAVLIFAETSVTDQHWSVRKAAGSQ